MVPSPWTAVAAAAAAVTREPAPFQPNRARRPILYRHDVEGSKWKEAHGCQEATAAQRARQGKEQTCSSSCNSKKTLPASPSILRQTPSRTTCPPPTRPRGTTTDVPTSATTTGAPGNSASGTSSEMETVTRFHTISTPSDSAKTCAGRGPRDHHSQDHKILSTAKACQARTTTDWTQLHPTRSSSSKTKKKNIGGTGVVNHLRQPANPSCSLPSFPGTWLSKLSARP